MNRLFAFEDDFVSSLRCIPMAVRYRLDLTGVKLKLNEWSKLSQPERRLLLDRPFAAPAEVQAWKDEISVMVAKACGAAPSLLPELPAPQWEEPALPSQVREQAASLGIALSDKAWASLSTLQRFALIKLSRPGHENRNFRPALEEFGLV